MWTQLYGVCYCLSNSYAIVFRHSRLFNYRSQFQERQKPHPLISRRAVRRRHYRPRIKSQKTARSAAGVEPTTFRTAATDDDRDLRLHRNGHRGLVLGPLLGFLAAPQIILLLSNAKSSGSVPNHRCQLHCIVNTIIVCCNRTAHSQHCLPTGVEVRELNLKCATTTGKLNPGPFCTSSRAYNH